MRTFRCGDKLQKLLRIIQPLLEFRAEGLSSDLRGYADIGGPGVGGHEFHFIDLDAGFFSAQRIFNLLRDILRFRPGRGEGFD